MLNFNEVIELKKFLSDNNAQNIHLHDTCGGQYFTVDNGDSHTEGLISDYLLKKKQQVVFADDKSSFTIVQNKKF